MDTIDDVFCVGEAAAKMDRWRPFVDVSYEGKIDPDWHPQLHNDRLLQAHARAARTAYEHAVVLESLEGSPRKWVTRPVYVYFKLIAEIELRCIEVEIASFQLTSNTIGIDLRADKEKLYAAAVFVHASHLFLWDLACKTIDKKTGRGEITANKPSRTDGPKRLAALLDEELMALHAMVMAALPRLKAGLEEAEAAGLATRLGLAVKALNGVMLIL